MNELVKFIMISIRNTFLVSGSNGFAAYLNLSNITGFHDFVDIGQGLLGIVAAGVAIVYGFYNIRLIKGKIQDRKNDRQDK